MIDPRPMKERFEEAFKKKFDEAAGFKPFNDWIDSKIPCAFEAARKAHEAAGRKDPLILGLVCYCPRCSTTSMC